MTTSSYADFYASAEAEGNLNKGGGGQRELLPAGPYNGIVKVVSQKHPEGGKKFGLLVEVTEGPYAGKEAWANIGMSKANPRSMAAFFITCEKFGLTKEIFFRQPAPSDNEIANYFKDVPVTIEVSHREWNEKTVQDGKVVSVNKTAGVDAAPAAFAPALPAATLPTAVSAPVPAAAAAPFNPLGAGGQVAS